MADYVGQPWIICGGGGQQLAPESPTESVCIYVCVCVCMYVCENECVMSPCNLMARPPSSSSQPTILWETCSSLRFSSLPPPSSTHPQPDVFVSTKQGALWGHQLVLPHGVTWPMNRGTPKLSTHIISVLPLEAALS